jgi:hypothetical protein
VLPSSFVPVAVTVLVAVIVTSCQFCQFYGVLACSSDAPILRQFCGDAQLLSGFLHCWFALLNRACSRLY